MRTSNAKTADNLAWNIRGLLWLSALVFATLILIAIIKLVLLETPWLLKAATIVGSMALSTVLWALRDIPPTSIVKNLSHRVAAARWTRRAIATYVVVVLISLGATVRENIGCQFPGVKCLAVAGFDRDTTGSKFADNWLSTEAVLRRKMALVFDKVDSVGAVAESACAGFCVTGSFRKVERGWQLQARPLIHHTSLQPPVQITEPSESPGAILGLWHDLADSLVARFGIPLSAALRNAMRAEPTTDSIALAKNNSGVQHVLDAQRTEPPDQRTLELAASELRRALERDSTYSSAWANLGYTQGLLGDRRAAIASYETALRRLPRHAPYHYHLGRLLLDSGDTARAITQLRQARLFSPRDVHTLISLGDVYVSRQKFADAEEVLADGASVDSTFVPLLIARGRLEYQRGNYDNAVRFLQGASARPAHNRREFEARVVAVSDLARAFNRLGDTPAGCAALDSIIPYLEAISLRAAVKSQLTDTRNELRCG